MKNVKLLILSIFIAGCTTNYVQQSTDWNPKAPQMTLLAHYKFKDVGKSEVGLLEAIKVLAGGDNPFQNIGVHTLPPLIAGLKKKI